MSESDKIKYLEKKIEALKESIVKKNHVISKLSSSPMASASASASAASASASSEDSDSNKMEHLLGLMQGLDQANAQNMDAFLKNLDKVMEVIADINQHLKTDEVLKDLIAVANLVNDIPKDSISDISPDRIERIDAAMNQK